MVTNELQRRLQNLEARVVALEAESVLLRSLLGRPILSQAEEQSSGVCRDLTGDTLQYEGEEKVHSSGKPGGQSA